MLALNCCFFFLPDSYVAGAYCNFQNETLRDELEIYNLQNKNLHFFRNEDLYWRKENTQPSSMTNAAFEQRI